MARSQGTMAAEEARGGEGAGHEATMVGWLGSSSQVD